MCRERGGEGDGGQKEEEWDKEQGTGVELCLLELQCLGRVRMNPPIPGTRVGTLSITAQSNILPAPSNLTGIHLKLNGI